MNDDTHHYITLLRTWLCAFATQERSTLHRGTPLLYSLLSSFMPALVQLNLTCIPQDSYFIELFLGE